MKITLQNAWRTRGFLAHVLWPVSFLYGVVVSLRRTLYRGGFFKVERMDVPVVVVGNLVAGGAGKTPLVMALVRHLEAGGMQVGVVSRGYGRKTSDCREVFADSPVSDAGDEPVFIKRSMLAPVFVANRRPEAARALLSAYPATQLVICDDGLQHYALARDIEVAVFDDRGIGNGWLLPAGPLRERWPQRSEATCPVVLHTGQTPAFGGYTSSRRLASHATAADGSKVELTSLRGRPLMALAGIANPQAFFAMLTSSGLTLARTISLPDHHDFSNDRLDVSPGMTVLCTEKDAIKLFDLPAMASIQLLSVPLEFEPESAFFDTIDKLVAALNSPLPSTHGY